MKGVTGSAGEIGVTAGRVCGAGGDTGVRDGASDGACEGEDLWSIMTSLVERRVLPSLVVSVA